MVNTFLVRGNYVESARLLDRARLGKQRVEAQQILMALEELRFIAKLFGILSYPENLNTPIQDRTNWIRSVVTTFNRWYSAIIIRQGEIYPVPKGRKMYKPESQLYQLANEIVYEPKTGWTGKSSECLLPGDRQITMAWKSHPAVRMWLGLESSLKIYLNAHIDEWMRRGYQNTMSKHIVCEPITHPNWAIDDSSMIISQKAKLLWKELTRKEKPWYVYIPDFISVYQPNPDYVWT